MITANIKQIGRSEFERIGNEGFAHHGGLRRGYRRFKQRFVPKAGRSAVSPQHFAVNRFHRFDGQMLDLATQDNRLKSAEFFLINRFAAAAAALGSIVGRMGVSTIEPPAWTLTFTWSPTFNRVKSINAASKMIPWEFPTLEMVLVTL